MRYRPSWDAMVAFGGGLVVAWLGSVAGLYPIGSVAAYVVWTAWIVGCVLASLSWEFLR